MTCTRCHGRGACIWSAGQGDPIAPVGLTAYPCQCFQEENLGLRDQNLTSAKIIGSMVVQLTRIRALVRAHTDEHTCCTEELKAWLKETEPKESETNEREDKQERHVAGQGS